MALKINIIPFNDINDNGIPYMAARPASFMNKVFNNMQLVQDEIDVIVPTNRKELYSVLHEQMHLKQDFNKYDGDVWPYEVLAWRDVYSCINPLYHDELTDVAYTCLETYQPHVRMETIKKILLKAVEENA